MNNFERRASPAEIAEEATQILVPKGADNERSRQAFMEATGVEIPEFKREQLLVYSQKKEFALVRAATIPGLVAMENPKQGNRIGVTGTDVRSETLAPVHATRIGEAAICRLSLLARPDDKDWVTGRLNGDSRQLTNPLDVVTAYPRLLVQAAAARDLPVVPLQLPDYMPTPLKGSGEIMPELLGVALVADLVDSGQTAADNNKTELLTLANIYPELITKRG